MMIMMIMTTMLMVFLMMMIMSMMMSMMSAMMSAMMTSTNQTFYTKIWMVLKKLTEMLILITRLAFSFAFEES